MNDNDKDKKTYVTSGIGIPEVLTIIFVVLKLCGVINWSWLWVLSPIWISIGLALIIFIIVIIIAVIIGR